MSEFPEGLVTDQVTVGVVHGLEVVDIDQHDGERFAGAMLARDLLPQDFKDCSPIADAGEHVV